MKNKAQSTLEYILVLAVIIAIIVAASRSIMRPAIESSLNKLANAINQAADSF